MSATEPVVERQGSCLCGEVSFRINGPLRPVVACHCSQCRKTSGHFVAATAAYDDDIAFEVETGLAWYRSSAGAQRGFCRTCGSNLFWKADGSDCMAIMAGSLQRPTGLETATHIFVADKGDYYRIEDDLPQLAEGGHGIRIPREPGPTG